MASTMFFTDSGNALTQFNSAANIVQTEQPDVNANLFYLGLPVATISTSFSQLAKQTIILITGRFRGTKTEQLAFVTEIEIEINKSGFAGQEQKTYTNAIGREYFVRLNILNYVISNLNPNHLDYTLEVYKESN